MRLLLKKITAALMVCVLAVGVMPSVALANNQTPVTRFTIVDNTPQNALVSGVDANRMTTYTLSLQWEVPYPAAGGTVHDTVGYDISYRNATTSAGSGYIELYTGYTAQSGAVPGDIVVVNNVVLPLLDSSIYEFRVAPYHIHTNPDTGETTKVIPTGREQHALFFTDLIVEKPSGFGSDITVSWVAPTFGGRQEIFDRYKMYWARNPAVPMDNTSGFSSADVNISDATSAIYANGRYRYTYTLKNTNIGMGAPPYRIKVEPALGQQYVPWRNKTINKTNLQPDFPKDTELVSYSFAHTSYSVREYRSDEFQLQIPLEWSELNATQFRLSWRSEYIQVSQYPIRIFEYDPDTGVELEIGRLGPGSSGINFWIVDKPNPARPMQYYIRLTELDHPDLKSMVVEYDPYAVAFEPYKPSILKIEKDEDGVWQLTWNAFVREIYTVEDEYFAIGNGECVDVNVDYEIWVTDNISYYEEGIELEPVMSFSPSRLDEAAPDWTYTTGLYQYSTPEGGKKNLEPNKVYYVKIVATRRDTEQVSPEARGTFYLTPSGNLPTNPLMMAKPPLKVASVENDAINISWVTQWYEVYNDHANADFGNPNYPEGWYSSVGVGTGSDGNKIYIYGAPPSPSQGIYDLSSEGLIGQTQDQAFAQINSLLGINAADDTLPKRFMDITGAGYQIHTARYEQVIGTEGDPDEAAKAYLAKLNASGPWSTIVEPGEDVTEWRVAEVNNPENIVVGNTSYVIFFRPVSYVDGEEVPLPAFYPVYVTATTPNEPGDISIKPITPNIRVDSSRTTNTTITVYWETIEGLNYELGYGELMSQYSSGGLRISAQQILDNAEPYVNPDDGRQYLRYTITGLFANIEYYIWIRSTVEKEQSDWSNPISETTKDLDVPDPPRGLWVASQDVINEYNAANNSEYKPISSDYMILEWMRDFNDTGTETTSTAVGNVVRMDSQSLSGSAFMARFGSLVPNREYYIRAKTILTMLRAGGNVRTQYSYCVQVSTSADFTDVMEIYIPALPAAPALERDMVRKESEWTVTIRVKTLTSEGEYDGEWDERLYPLPESDFEISYDPQTGELKYRFRSMGKAADGTSDNSVDQRFITRMIQDRVYIYELDLTKYDGRNVLIRTVELPYSIVRAMDERKVSLRLIADNLALTIAPNGLKTAEINEIKDFSAAATAVTYRIEQSGTVLSANEEFASVPHKLSVVINTPSTVKQVTNLDQDLKVALKLNSRYSVLNKNINTYLSDANSAGWEAVKNTYSNSAGTMTFNTKKVAAYSAIAKSMPTSAEGTLPDSAYTLLTKLNITDLRTFEPNQQINASQFNNIIAALARNKPSVAIHASMSDDDYKALGKSNILVSGTEVSREAGIHALIRLYELKTNQAVKNYGTVADTVYTDISSANPTYQASLLKAAKLGFFKSYNVSAPKAGLSMGDAFEMFAIIIDDSGM